MKKFVSIYLILFSIFLFSQDNQLVEIETNDVVCNHASTVAGIDEEQLFYLESKGIKTSAAERLIIAGFFDEVTAKVDDPLLVKEIDSIMTEVLQNRFSGEGE